MVQNPPTPIPERATSSAISGEEMHVFLNAQHGHVSKSKLLKNGDSRL
jgi:hypothetical protein